MSLILAIALFLAFLAGIMILFLYLRSRKKKPGFIIAISIVSLVCLAASLFFALDIFFDRPVKPGPSETALITASFENTQTNPQITEIAKTETEQTQSTYTTKTSETEMTAPTESAVSHTVISPEDMEPALHPDIFGMRGFDYPSSVSFASVPAAAEFILHNYINNRFNFSFYLDKSFATEDEAVAYAIIDQACEAALSYYLFSAYDVYTMRSEDHGDQLLATVIIHYRENQYDLEARRAALSYVTRHPAPEGAFTDFESEKLYAKGIHDYIARRITYSPIGYDPEKMLGMEKYEACQEAYNALVSPDNTAVCAGYARAFALIAQYAGINAAYVYGNEDDIESHAWNMIFPCDGSEPVIIDVTWDDGISDDIPGQRYVSDEYFYIPVSEDFDHEPAEHFAEFLSYMNNLTVPVS